MQKTINGLINRASGGLCLPRFGGPGGGAKIIREMKKMCCSLVRKNKHFKKWGEARQVGSRLSVGLKEAGHRCLVPVGHVEHRGAGCI